MITTDKQHEAYMSSLTSNLYEPIGDPACASICMLQPAGTGTVACTQCHEGLSPTTPRLHQAPATPRGRASAVQIHTLHAALTEGFSGNTSGRLTMLSKVCSRRAPLKGDLPYTSSCRRMPNDHQSTGAPACTHVRHVRLRRGLWAEK